MLRQKTVAVTGASALDLQIDPLLFVVPVLFILGVGLLFLRLYPLLLRGVYWLGKRYWPPTLYATLTQLGRTFKNYHFLVIFIIMTLSVGIFSATSARTINRNAEENILYSTGSDMVLKELWEDDAPKGRSDEGTAGPAEQNNGPVKVNYLEPSFLRFSKLDGIEHAAKVFDRYRSSIEYNGKYIENVRLMAIDSYDFGKVAWLRSGLMPHHINEYLNLLASSPDMCLISESVSKEYGIQAGDYINLGWTGSTNAVFTVGGVISYWPSWNPNISPQNAQDGAPMLVVANLSYVQNHLGLEPYEVWLKLKPGAKSSQVYESIKKNGIAPLSLTDVPQQIVQVKNSPFHLAINGVLTLGFIISGIICFLGFLIFWILSIKTRTLQFGIFRAMGLSAGKLVSIIVWEQLLTSGVAIFSGLIIGLFSSRFFVPFFQMTFDSYSQVPPFQVISYMDDRLRIYFLTGSMLALGLIILGILISRINISHALKLGED
jgi:putative ABC transport system permease protein